MLEPPGTSSALPGLKLRDYQSNLAVARRLLGVAGKSLSDETIGSRCRRRAARARRGGDQERYSGLAAADKNLGALYRRVSESPE